MSKMQNNQMQSTKLNNGNLMPLLGLGVYDMYGKEAQQSVETAIEVEYRLIDTASMYENEKEIGAAIKASSIKRTDLFLTTKLNNTDHGYDAALKAFEVSLDKLQLDYVDLYLIHWPIKEGRKESWKAIERIYAEGRAKSIGVANYTLPFLKELETYSNIIPAVNQIEFTPWLFDIETYSYCKKIGIQLQSYSPITRGIKFTDERLLLICVKYQKTPAQIILNWNLQLGVSTIPKSSNKKRLIENLESANFKLDMVDVEIMNTFNEGFRICDDPAIFL
jgi:diketogulonate reductase-like aldo/keto reductase